MNIGKSTIVVFGVSTESTFHFMEYAQGTTIAGLKTRKYICLILTGRSANCMSQQHIRGWIAESCECLFGTAKTEVIG